MGSEMCIRDRPWTVSISVNPVINGSGGGSAADGFGAWNLGFTQTEGTTEGGSAVSLASAANYVLLDPDGSEQVVSVTFDLSDLIADAGIAAQLEALSGPGSDLNTICLLYTSPSPRDRTRTRMPSSA